MRVFGMYLGAGLGATAYEVQVHRLVVRFLRPKCYFWPRRHTSMSEWWVFPAVVRISIHPKGD